MLNKKNIKQLKALSNSIKIRYQIGKEEIDDNVIKLLNNALTAHELIKVYFNKSVADNIDKLSKEIIDKTNSLLVTIIGHTLIIYKANTNKKDRIILKD